MVGVYASAAAGDSDEKEMLIPCLVGNRFLLGSSGCAIDGDNPRYVSVRFTLNSESLRYVNVSMQDISNGNISNGRNANGIIGLIRRQYSISQVTLKTVNGITCTYRVWSKKVVECCVSGVTTNTLSSGSVIDFGTIPSELRPKTTSFIVCNILWNGGKVYFRTYNDGSVSVLCADQEFSGGSSVRCSRTWIIQHSISQTLKTSKMTLPRIYIGENTATKVNVSWNVDFSKIKAVFLTYICNDSSDRIVLSDYDSSSITLRGSVKQYISASLTILHE